MKSEILVIDDEKDIRNLIKDILEDEGYNVRTASSSTEAFEKINDLVPKVIILDIWLQGSELDGLGILEIIHEKYPNIKVIMISGHGNIKTAVTSIKLGAYDYIEKPFSEEKISIMIKRAIETSALMEENIELKFKVSEEKIIIGDSSIINKVKSSIEKLASASSRVLLTGPSGCGKTLIAKQIHQKSQRNQKNFIIFDPYGKSAQDLELELLGEPKINNISKLPRKIGLLEAAHLGTLYIKSIDLLPHAIQSLFLKFLQSSNQSYDIRIIASTTKDLKQEVAGGHFREDLYYRVNIAPLVVPSLQDRKQDLPLLATHFISVLNKIAGYKKIILSENTIIALQSYYWPGNIRQLKNVLEWLMIMQQDNDQEEIIPSMLPSEILSPAENNKVCFDNFSELISMPLRDAREIFESHYLKAQLKRFNGNISKVANAIGMERSALHRKLKSFDLVFLDEKK